MDYRFEKRLLGVVGDIHGEFHELLDKLKPVENSVIVVAGDIGFGFNDTKVKKLEGMFEKIFSKFLKKRNITLCFMRGNHDDPEYFKAPIKDILSSDNIVILEDYDTLTINNFKVLCVGGGLSIDRVSRVVNKSYWENELPVYKDLDLGNIDLLITHSIFSHPNVKGKISLSFFALHDPFLEEALKEESNIIYKIVEKYNPKMIVHGHMHNSYISDYNGIVLRGLGICELLNVKIDE